MSSDIQVFVRWKEQTIFAGEDVECVITFKNIAPIDSPANANGSQHQKATSRPANGVSNGGSYSLAKRTNLLSLGNRRSLPVSPRRRQTLDKTHRPSSSLSSPLALSRSFPPTPASSKDVRQISGHRHKRSVSIISLEPELNTERKEGIVSFSPKPPRSHARSASFQVLPRRHEVYGEGSHSGGRSPNRFFPSADSPSNLSYTSLKSDSELSRMAGRSRSGVSSPVPQPQARRSNPLLSDFKFPQAFPHTAEPMAEELPVSAVSPFSPTSHPRDVPTLEEPGRLAPATRILSNSTMNGSSRSSMEFYSLSNNSAETLESEYISYPMNHSQSRLRHRRHFSNMEPLDKSQNPSSQTLLMGYAQINASFTVDGSLVNQSLFDEVKRKGVVGNLGGAQSSAAMEKPRNGFWGALKWNNLGDSIHGLLSSNELSGLRDMRGVTSYQSVPLLSTPQSLLFVDLRLRAGEERSFSFCFTLPRGLPASHKGKAIKISYNLVIGTQRGSSPKEVQRVHRVNIPFRVLSGVDGQGEVLGHDLMRPYVLLRDEARVQRVENNPLRPVKEKSISAKSWSTASEFLSFVDEILDRRYRRESFTSVATPLERHISYNAANGKVSCKDAIDLAVLRSNQSTTSDRSANRFEITRDGRRIAVIVLNRPSHRLGETVVATIDFSYAALPCYSLRASLETSEKVSPTIALRSSASIARATRRIYASCFENTLFSTRVVFTPAIPVSATPTLITSGVNLEWVLRFEFVTSSLHEDADDIGLSGIHLLEAVERDDRGTLFASLESVPCESFEVAIPLTVYGGTTQEPEGEELEGIPI